MNTSDCILLAVLLAFSAYFSASETALSTVNKIRLKSYADNGSKKAKIALDIAENYDRTISTILVGNNVVNTASAALMTTVTTALFGASGAVIATAVTTVLVLVFGEILPKTYGKENSEKLALTIAGSMHFLIVLLTPVVSIFRLLQWAMVRLCSKGDKSPSVTEEELKYILDTIEEEGVMQEDEAQLVQSALDFNDVPVQKLLTHRVDLVAVDIHDSLDSIRQVVLEERFTRIPVYDGNIDHVIGILQSRDFLEALVRGGEEEIVGDIWDEDEEEELPFQQLPDGSYEVSGDMDIDDLFEDFGYYNRHFESESSTVGGWAMEMLEHLPEPGEVFEYDGFTVQVLEVDEQRVTRLRVTFDRSRSSMEAKGNDD